MKGFLVVLATPSDYLEGSRNARYRGVDRLPPYPSKLPEEQEAIDEYVFGDFKDRQGAIPTLEKAQQLCGLFRKSARKFEVIYYETIDAVKDTQIQDSLGFLGFDVAFPRGDRWSIVSDFPANPEMAHFATLLNGNGLFPTQGEAERFLSEYRRRELADHDQDLQVLRVYAVL